MLSEWRHCFDVRLRRSWSLIEDTHDVIDEGPIRAVGESSSSTEGERTSGQRNQRDQRRTGILIGSHYDHSAGHTVAIATHNP